MIELMTLLYGKLRYFYSSTSGEIAVVEYQMAVKFLTF